MRRSQPFDIPASAADWEPFPPCDIDLAPWLDHASAIPVSGRRWHCRPGWSIPPRTVQDAMWFYIESGRIDCTLGNNPPQRANPGDLFLIPRGTRHAIELASKRPLVCCCAHFYLNWYDCADLIHLCRLGGVFPAPPEAPPAIIQFTREATCQPSGWEHVCRAALIAVITHCLRQQGAPHVDEEALRLQPVLTQIDATLADPALTIGALAKTLHVSEPWLRKLFRRVFGLSPVAFLRRRRIEHACLLLRSTDLSLQEIARECGFTDAGYFHRTFRDLTRQTPRQYRKHPGM